MDPFHQPLQGERMADAAACAVDCPSMPLPDDACELGPMSVTDGYISCEMYPVACTAAKQQVLWAELASHFGIPGGAKRYSNMDKLLAAAAADYDDMVDRLREEVEEEDLPVS